MSRANRAQRRREQRKPPLVLVGDGIVATPLLDQFEARPHAQLPPKRRGEHRWMATAAYVVTLDDVRGGHDPDRLKILDHENLYHLAIGCWDCEQPLGVIAVDSRCPSDGSDS